MEAYNLWDEPFCTLPVGGKSRLSHPHQPFHRADHAPWLRHARRISCDSFGSLDQSAYLNNCITYLWWMNDCLYRFNDPDHIVTYKTYDKHSTTLEEGITRYNTGVICGGLMLASDDYGIPEARRRSRLVLTNEEVNEAAAKGGAFRPVSVPGVNPRQMCS